MAHSTRRDFLQRAAGVRLVAGLGGRAQADSGERTAAALKGLPRDSYRLLTKYSTPPFGPQPAGKIDMYRQQLNSEHIDILCCIACARPPGRSGRKAEMTLGSCRLDSPRHGAWSRIRTHRSRDHRRRCRRWLLKPRHNPYRPQNSRGQRLDASHVLILKAVAVLGD